MIKKYDKLVRDNIIKIIEKDNKKAKYRIANDKEYALYLIEKLDEEVNEFTDAKNAEELADILEVLEALAHLYNIDMKKVQCIKEAKSISHGKFEQKYILESVED